MLSGIKKKQTQKKSVSLSLRLFSVTKENSISKPRKLQYFPKLILEDEQREKSTIRMWLKEMSL